MLIAKKFILVFRLIVIVIVITVLFWLLKFCFPLLTGQYLGTTNFGTIPEVYVKTPLIIFHIYELEDLQDKVSLDLENIILPENTCIESIRLYSSYHIYQLPQATIRFPKSASFLSSYGSHSGPTGGGGDAGAYAIDKCSDSNGKATIFSNTDLFGEETLEERSINLLLSKKPSFYFPFDESSSGFTMMADIYKKNDINKNRIKYDVAGLVTAPNSDENILIKYHNTDNEPYLSVSINFNRPLAYRVLTIIFLISIFIFIVILFFIERNSDFMRASTGILFGLWSIQDILVPKYILEPTIINSLILVLYIFFMFITIIRLIKIYLWKILDRFIGLE